MARFGDLRGRLLAASALAVLSFVALALGLLTGGLGPLDQAASEAAAGWRSHGLTVLFSTVTVLGNGEALGPLMLLLLGAAAASREVRRSCIWLVGLATAAGLLDAGLKALFARPRPLHPLLQETSYSFPSGHAMIALCLLGFLCFLVATAGPRLRPLAWALAALVLLVGCSRVYLGVHYPADVLAGYLAGVPLLSLAILTYRRELAPRRAEAPR